MQASGRAGYEEGGGQLGQRVVGPGASVADEARWLRVKCEIPELVTPERVGVPSSELFCHAPYATFSSKGADSVTAPRDVTVTWE